jgi:hypothetical protein
LLSGLRSDPGKEWAQANGMWVFGATDTFAVLNTFNRLLKNPLTGVDPLLSDWDFQSSWR